jgi:hypothetical protein
MSLPRSSMRPALCASSAGNDAQDDRLAAARRPEEADELALRDLQIHALQCEAMAELLAHAGEKQERRRAGRRGAAGSGPYYFGSLFAL